MLRSLLLAAALAGLAAALDFRTIVGYVDSEPQLSTLAGLLRDAHLDLVLEAPGGRTSLSRVAWASSPCFVVDSFTTTITTTTTQCCCCCCCCSSSYCYYYYYYCY